MDPSDVLVYVGLAITAVGAVVLLLPMPADAARTRGIAGDLGKVMEEVNKLFEKFDKRYRPGVMLMLVGLVLVGFGVYLKADEAKDAAENEPAAFVEPGPGSAAGTA